MTAAEYAFSRNCVEACWTLWAQCVSWLVASLINRANSGPRDWGVIGKIMIFPLHVPHQYRGTETKAVSTADLDCASRSAIPSPAAVRNRNVSILARHSPSVCGTG